MLARLEATGSDDTNDPELRIPLSLPAPSVVAVIDRLEFTLAFLSKLKFEAEETARLPERRPDILPEDVVPEVIPWLAWRDTRTFTVALSLPTLNGRV
jgi:hypothetical protein